MAATEPVDLLSLPSRALDGLSQPALRDALAYFDPEVVTIPGPTSPKGYASVRQASPDRPVDHPQLAQRGRRVWHYRATSQSGVRPASETPPSAGQQDLLSVQNESIIPDLTDQLATGERETTPEAATYLLVPRLAVEWDPTALETTLPAAESVATLARTVPERVTVLAGGMPADYHHEWTVDLDGEPVTVPLQGLGGADRGRSTVAQLTLTASGTAAPEVVDASQFGLQALDGVGEQTAARLRDRGVETTAGLRDLPASELATIPGVGRQTAETIHAHADVIESGEPLVLTNTTPVRTRTDQPPLCLDVETDGLSPTIIWQIGVYDPATDTHKAFIETEDPTDPAGVLAEFMNWLLANHDERTILTWNGDGFDYKHIAQFLDQHLHGYLEAWDERWTEDLYTWAIRDGNALLPGRTNKLEHVARALGHESADTGLTGAQTAAAYQEFMRHPDDPAHEPDWERHRRYCEDDCRALWQVYQSITAATRRNVTDSGAGGATGRQAGLTDF